MPSISSIMFMRITYEVICLPSNEPVRVMLPNSQIHTERDRYLPINYFLFLLKAAYYLSTKYARIFKKKKTLRQNCH